MIIHDRTRLTALLIFFRIHYSAVLLCLEEIKE